LPKGAQPERLVLFAAALSAARRTGHVGGGQDRRRLLLHDPLLDLTEELLPSAKLRPSCRQPLMLFGQYQQILSALRAILGDADELDFKLNGQRWAPRSTGSHHGTCPHALIGTPCPHFETLSASTPCW
jgi:hypothetical protein